MGLAWSSGKKHFHTDAGVFHMRRQWRWMSRGWTRGQGRELDSCPLPDPYYHRRQLTVQRDGAATEPALRVDPFAAPAWEATVDPSEPTPRRDNG